jgi:hypothetical protein
MGASWPLKKVVKFKEECNNAIVKGRMALDDVVQPEMSRDCHGYWKTRGFAKTGSTGTGTVVDFSTLWHIVYLYCGITGISWVY